METYSPDTRHAFEHTLGWLRQWACSRSFGLGTRLPWDPQFLVESLSDSTIYMAYYAVAHILQAGDMYGKEAGPVAVGELTDEAFDAIFLDKPPPADASPALLNVISACTREFGYWYPVDLRVSGKDLIQNHLTFCLYTHTAVWPARPNMWPQSMRCNGHLLLNAEKMSKSTGNFKTLAQAVAEYSADAMRAALADAGDTLDDANFEHGVANGAVLRLTREVEWIASVLPGGAAAQARAGDHTFADRAFDNALNTAIARTVAAYEGAAYREALKAGWYDLQSARDAWRTACGPAGLHAALTTRYIDVSTRLLAPICPHTCEHVWRDLLGRPGSVLTAGLPAGAPPDPALAAAAAALDGAVASLRRGVARLEAPPKAKKGARPTGPPPKVVGVDLHVSPAFTGWHAAVLAALDAAYDEEKGVFADGAMASALAAAAAPFAAAGGPTGDKAIKQAVAPFAKRRMDDATAGAGRGALRATLPFDEAALVRDNAAYVARCVGWAGPQCVRVTEEAPPDGVAAPVPGEPTPRFETAAA